MSSGMDIGSVSPRAMERDRRRPVRGKPAHDHIRRHLWKFESPDNNCCIAVSDLYRGRRTTRPQRRRKLYRTPPRAVIAAIDVAKRARAQALEHGFAHCAEALGKLGI